jgi:hypothetical protein
MGLTPFDFYRMTPAEFYLAVRGFNEAEWKKWRHTRLIGYTTYSTAPRKKGKLPQSITRWLPLPNDKNAASLTPVDKMAAVFNAIKEKQNK